MKDFVYSDREDALSVIDSVRFSWVRSILEQTGMNLEGCFPEDESQEHTIEQKAKLRSCLKQNDVLIVDNHDGSLKIYIDEELIAEWRQPQFTVVQDLKQINPKKKLYTKIQIDYSSVFDEEDNG